jgi:hypothetical protein
LAEKSQKNRSTAYPTRIAMNEPILQLHEEMIRAISRFDGETTGTAKTDHCYRIAADYWQLAKEDIRVNGFPDDPAEIDFFRNQKAKFTGLLEYYLLLYRYQINADAGNAMMEQFRQEETVRIRTFRETHAVFIHYYEEGRTDWDNHYFLRRKFHKVQRPAAQIYDRATDFWTNGDWIVTLLDANRRFEEFLGAAKFSV